MKVLTAARPANAVYILINNNVKYTLYFYNASIKLYKQYLYY